MARSIFIHVHGNAARSNFTGLYPRMPCAVTAPSGGAGRRGEPNLKWETENEEGPPERAFGRSRAGRGLGLSSRELSAQVDDFSGARECPDTRGRDRQDEPPLGEKHPRREGGGIQPVPAPVPSAHEGEAAVCAKRILARPRDVDDDGLPGDEVGHRLLDLRASLEVVEVS